MHEVNSAALSNKNLLFVVNPVAGNGLSSSAREDLRRVEKIFGQFGNQVDVVETNAPEHATDIAHDAVSSQTDAIVVVGGDGTLNEVIQATVGSEMAVATIPTGLFNVWANEMGISKDMKRSCQQIIGGSTVKTVDVGSINGKVFLQFANLGFDSEQYMKVHKPYTARKHGAAATFAQTFARSMLDGWVYRGHPAMVMHANTEHYLNNMLIGVISNSRKYGVLTLNKDTIVDDGKLETTFFEGRLGPQFLAQFAQIVAGRERVPGLQRGQIDRNEVMSIQSEDLIGITIDGNPMGYSDTIVINAIPSSQKVIVPDIDQRLFKH